MRIDHLINGQSVASQHYFETINPATQEMLAEVASGGEAEVNAAVAAGIIMYETMRKNKEMEK